MRQAAPCLRQVKWCKKNGIYDKSVGQRNISPPISRSAMQHTAIAYSIGTTRAAVLRDVCAAAELFPFDGPAVRQALREFGGRSLS